MDQLVNIVPGPAAPVPRLALRPREAAAAVGVSERKMDDLIRSGEVETFRDGNVRVVPVHKLIEWMDRQVRKERDAS